ncbi:MAG TPA: hypothetical protein DCL21_00650 [Alphaproteobacteria bacterium]|nr:hypothetical protein [Alphaproteobacteria bacterium]
MSFTKFATLTLAISSAMFSAQASAENYKKLTYTVGSGHYTNAVRDGRVHDMEFSNYNLRRDLRSYYKDMVFEQGDDKNRVLEDPNLYSGFRQMAGEVCAIVYRHQKSLPEQDYFGETPSLGARNEQVPFIDTSDFATEQFEFTWPRKLKRRDINAYRFFLAAGNEYAENRLSFPLHMLGLIGGNGRDYHSDSLTVSVNTAFYNADNGRANYQKDILKNYNSLMTLLLLPTTSEIVKTGSQDAAFKYCYNNVKVITPNWR